MISRSDGNKYHARRVFCGGRWFDSKKEADRYFALLMMQRAGEITDLSVQVPFELIPVQRDEATGKVIERAVKYVADFVYYEKGKRIVEDTKGVRTADYIIKRKLMLHKYGIKIREV